MIGPDEIALAKQVIYSAVQSASGQGAPLDPDSAAKAAGIAFEKIIGNFTGDPDNAAIAEAGRYFGALGYMPGSSGNISVRQKDGTILITPSGKSKGRLTPQDIIRIDMSGNILNGTTKPSSEYKMHLLAYRERDDVNAVVHCHPPYATAMATAGIDMETPVLPEAVLVLGKIPLASYGTPSTDQVPLSLLPHIKKDAFLLENHGALCLGADLSQACHRMETLEFTAKVICIARSLGRERNLTKAQEMELKKVWGL